MSGIDGRAMKALLMVENFIRTERHAILASDRSRNPAENSKKISAYYARAAACMRTLKSIVLEYKNAPRVTDNLDHEELWKLPRDEHFSKKQSLSDRKKKNDFADYAEKLIADLKDLIEISLKPNYGDVEKLVKKTAEAIELPIKAQTIVNSLNRVIPEIKSSQPQPGPEVYCYQLLILFMIVMGWPEKGSSSPMHD